MEILKFIQVQQLTAFLELSALWINVEGMSLESD